MFLFTMVEIVQNKDCGSNGHRQLSHNEIKARKLLALSLLQN